MEYQIDTTGGGPGKLSIRCLTFNVAGWPPPEDEVAVAKLLGVEEGNGEKSDIIAVGLQEVHSRVDKFLYDSLVSGEDEWTAAITELLYTLGYIRIRHIRVLGTILSVFVKSKHLLHLRQIETGYVRLSLGGYWGLKAAVCVRFLLYGSSFCLVNSHLSAHDHQVGLRRWEYNYIVHSLRFKSSLYVATIYEHDYVAWMGDLNFRLERPDALPASDIVSRIEKLDLPSLQKDDQLRQSREKGLAFQHLEEDTVEFAPTYKFVRNTDVYDTKRRPAWTDRILYFRKDKPKLQLNTSSYSSHPSVKLSDHRPVTLCLTAKVAAEKDWEEQMRTRDDQPYLPPFKPVIKFKEQQAWTIGCDCTAEYQVLSDAAYLKAWDWIGLYKSDFKSLEDYVTFTWASFPAKDDGLPKRVTFLNITVPSDRKYVLIYFGETGDVLGISQEFDINNT